MRFVTAVGLLLNQARCSSSRSEVDMYHGRAYASSNKSSSSVVLATGADEKLLKQQLQATKHNKKSVHREDKLEPDISPIRNRHRKNEEEVLECDPKDLDIGILTACGSTNTYCAESHSSSTGGICKSRHRHLQFDLCNSDTSCPQGTFCNFEYSSEAGTCAPCPCSVNQKQCYVNGYFFGLGLEGFYECMTQCPPSPLSYEYDCRSYSFMRSYCLDGQDPQTGSFYYFCRGSSAYCIYSLGVLKYNCCYSSYFSKTYGSDKTEYIYHYEFNRPYSQQITFAFDSTDDSCRTMEFDEEPCNACNVIRDPQFGIPCIEFDCSNVLSGVVGTTCGVTRRNGRMTAIAPIFNQCAAPQNLECGMDTHVDWLFHTDNFAQDTSWEILDKINGNLIESGTVSENADDTQFRFQNCADPSRCYTLSLKDTGGNGFCCGGDPSFQLIVDGILLAGGDEGNSVDLNFGSSIDFDFGNCPDPPAGTCQDIMESCQNDDDCCGVFLCRDSRTFQGEGTKTCLPPRVRQRPSVVGNGRGGAAGSAKGI